ncbi:MAG: putative N-formylglutamate amidohydrolase, partial [Rhizorhabdus sp.]|nr:putative N-formylglutamate amidohydrolase [Rhizorhabdus sp.]
MASENAFLMATQYPGTLLGPDDPAPVIAFNTDRPSPFLLIGDHAGIAIPASLGTLGLQAPDLARHIASDIGVCGLGEALALRLDCGFLHQTYSRLVIDCNRDPTAADAIPEVSDDTIIPGNCGIGAEGVQARIAAIHAPYQHAIADEIARRAASGHGTVLVSLHSFTPAMQGVSRPWHVGILHEGGDESFALAVLEELRKETDLVVGDNEPYHMDATDHSVPRHAFAAGLPYVELEIRQDLLADAAGQRHWSEILATALLGALPG